MVTRPTGYIVFTPDGRMMAVVEAEGRKPPENDEQRAGRDSYHHRLHRNVPTRGNKFTTKVDVSWNPAWVGTEQVRDYRLEGDELEVRISVGHESSLLAR